MLVSSTAGTSSRYSVGAKNGVVVLERSRQDRGPTNKSFIWSPELLIKQLFTRLLGDVPRRIYRIDSSIKRAAAASQRCGRVQKNPPWCAPTRPQLTRPRPPLSLSLSHHSLSTRFLYEERTRADKKRDKKDQGRWNMLTDAFGRTYR